MSGLIFVAAWLGAIVSVAAPAEDHLFGLTNLWEFHLMLDATNWESLTPSESTSWKTRPTERFPQGPVALEFTSVGRVFV